MDGSQGGVIKQGEFCGWGLLIPSFPFLQDTLVPHKRSENLMLNVILPPVPRPSLDSPGKLLYTGSSVLCKRLQTVGKVGIYHLAADTKLCDYKPYPQYRGENATIN